MSDRVAVMFEGSIAQIASPQDLYSRPADRRVADFLGAMNFLPARIEGVRAEIAGLGPCAVTLDQIIGAEGTAEAGMRPEAMTMLDVQPAEGLREAQGTITDRAYYGDMTYYMVQLPGAPGHVTVSMKNRPGAPVLEVGTETRIGWDPRAVLLFPA